MPNSRRPPSLADRNSGTVIASSERRVTSPVITPAFSAAPLS
ncbi:hypothetical protein [Saccharothrix coeruleofusca]|nr:hypothetical protein [Saccharothrix coeruleofusca]